MTPKVGQGAIQPKILQIYQDIKPDLDRVETHLQAQLRSEYPYLDGMQQHLTKFAGKRIRPALLLFAARVTGKVKDDHIVMGSVVEMLHNATLVHDDVLDEALLRRSYPTINRVWDNEQAIIFGDFIFGKTFMVAASLGNVEVFKILTDTAYRICTGELLQLSKKYDLNMDEQEYYHLIDLKTASLFEACCRLGCQGNNVSREVQDALAAYGRNLGIAFQVVDDWLDITGEENVMGKSLGTDITKGKITLPVIRLMQILKPEEARDVKELLQHPETARVRIGALVEKHGALDYCFAKAKSFVQEAKNALKPLRTSPYREALESIAEFVLDRQN
jgi:octaprenyl-diphosphate synthase